MADEMMREALIRAARPNLLGIFNHAPRQIPNFNFQFQDAPPQEVRRQRQEIFGIVWIWGLLPLPTINYALLWHRYRPESFSALFLRIVTTTAVLMVKFGRIVVYLMVTGNWIRDVLRFIMVFGSLVTFSENFFQDIFNYAMRGSPQLLERKCEMLKNGEPTMIEWNSITQVLVDTLAQNVKGVCINGFYETADGTSHELHEYTLDVKSLIFRFSDALVRVFPIFESVPTIFLTVTTIIIYVLYGLMGQLIGFNVLFFLLLHSFHRWMGLLSFIGRLCKALWYSTETMVF